MVELEIKFEMLPKMDFQDFLKSKLGFVQLTYENNDEDNVGQLNYD